MKIKNVDSIDLSDVSLSNDLLDTGRFGMSSYDPFLKRISCFSHTLQLVVKDGLKDICSLKTVINKASSFVSHVRKSHKASEILETCNIRL